MSLLGEAREGKRAILQRQAATQDQLTRAWVGTRATLLQQLAHLSAQMDAARQRGETISQAWLLREHRLEMLLGQVTTQIDGYAHSALVATTSARADAAESGAGAGLALLAASTPVGIAWSFTRLPTHATSEIAARLRNGKPLDTLFHGWGDVAADAAKQALFTGVALGWNPQQTARAMSQALGAESYARALTIARTETLGAWRDAQIATYRANDDVVGGWLWSAAKSVNTCAMCLAMDGTRHTLDETLDSHPNCFPAGVLVSGPPAIGSTARWYVGEVIEIKTVRGNFLTVTPNHPILTSHGWVAAGALREGGDVISRSGEYLRHAAPIANPKDDDIDAPIEQVAVAFRGASAMPAVAMPTTAEDFHGDGIGSQVHIVRANGLLRRHGDATFSEPLSEQQFCGRHAQLAHLASRSASFQALNRVFAPTASRMGRQGVDVTLLRGKSSLSELARGSDATSLYASLRKGARETAAADSKLLAQSILRFAGQVAPDQIIEIRRRPFRGHVYNLQTTEGWYICNSIITHNCACAAIPVTKSWADILGAAGVDASDIRETSIAATYQSGADWFDAQGAATQRAVLGPAKYAAFTAGDLSLHDLVGVAHDGAWGVSRYEKSLKGLGMDASDYL